jgi:CheY-like chemotaxis protein
MLHLLQPILGNFSPGVDDDDGFWSLQSSTGSLPSYSYECECFLHLPASFYHTDGAEYARQRQQSRALITFSFKSDESFFDQKRVRNMKPQILLVDDHQMARRALQLLLEQQGYACEVADEGASALARLKAGPLVDLVISDNQMPVMSGMELLTNIKTHSHLSSIPVILYSGNLTDELRMQARQVGAYAVFTKPYNFADLLATVGNVLSRD